MTTRSAAVRVRPKPPTCTVQARQHRAPSNSKVSLGAPQTCRQGRRIGPPNCTTQARERLLLPRLGGQARMWLRPSYGAFAALKVRLLQHIIEGGGRFRDAGKVQAVHAFQAMLKL